MDGKGATKWLEQMLPTFKKNSAEWEVTTMAIEALTMYEQIKWERDVALKTLEEHGIGLGESKVDTPTNTPTDISVESKPVCTDTVSRADAIKAFTLSSNGTRIPFVDCDNFPVEFPLKDIVETLLALPPADRPQGKWITKTVKRFCAPDCWYPGIFAIEGSWNEEEGSWLEKQDGFCSECGKQDEHHTSHKFCPNCGAKMG